MNGGNELKDGLKREGKKIKKFSVHKSQLLDFPSDDDNLTHRSADRNRRLERPNRSYALGSDTK